jgi:hypothetical protein
MVQNRASQVGYESVEFFVSNYTDSIFLRTKPSRQAIVRFACNNCGRLGSLGWHHSRGGLTPSTQTAKEAVAQ